LNREKDLNSSHKFDMKDCCSNFGQYHDVMLLHRPGMKDMNTR